MHAKLKFYRKKNYFNNLNGKYFNNLKTVNILIILKC